MNRGLVIWLVQDSFAWWITVSREREMLKKKKCEKFTYLHFLPLVYYITE